MSLLHQNSEEVDDAARGEDLTRGSSHRGLSLVVAAVAVSLAIGAYFQVSRQRDLVTGEIEEVWAHPQRVTTAAFDANGEATKQEQIDHVLLFVRAKLNNVSNKPLFLYRIAADATLADGVHTSYASPRRDYDRVFLAYPEIAPFHTEGLPLDATLAPGQSVDGTFVSSFRVTKQEWDARKDLKFTFSFQYQPSLTLAPHAAVIER